MKKRNIRVLSVNTSDGGSGAGKAAYRIHEAILKNGLESKMLVKNKTNDDKNVISIFSYRPKNKIYNIWSFIQNKAKNKIQQYKWHKYSVKENVFLSDLRSIPFHRAFQKTDFDILHLHWVNLRYLDLKILKKINKPIVWTLHDCWPFTGICHYFYECDSYKTKCGKCQFLNSKNPKDLSNKVWNVKNKIYSNLNLNIVTPSRWLANVAKESSLFRNFPITVIPNCINTELFALGSKLTACNNLNIDSGKRVILFGAYNAYNENRKGFKLLIEAIQNMVSEKSIENIQIVIFGMESPKKSSKFNLPIKYLGYVNSDKELSIVYQAADVLVVPSLSENLSNIIMEGLACGIPTVAFNIGGNSDLITHKYNGYLAKPCDIVDLEEGIIWCLENNDNKSLSDNARHKVVTEYNMELIANNYIELFDNIISKTQ